MKVKHLNTVITPKGDNDFGVSSTMDIDGIIYMFMTHISSGQLGLCSSIKKLCTIILITNGYESDKIEFVEEPN